MATKLSYYTIVAVTHGSEDLSHVFHVRAVSAEQAIKKVESRLEKSKQFDGWNIGAAFVGKIKPLQQWYTITH